MASYPSPSVECLNLIASLKYALAGDFESGEPLEQLEARWRALNWDDPAFLELTESMRATMPMPADIEANPMKAMAAFIHFQAEKIARDDEAARECLPAARELFERFSATVKFAIELTTLVTAMRTELFQRGADMTLYQLPTLPAALQPPKQVSPDRTDVA